MTYRVKHFIVDLYFDHDPPFVFDQTDYQLFAEYMSATSVHIMVRRLDSDCIPNGLQLLILYHDISQILTVPSCTDSHEICIPYTCDFAEPDTDRPVIRFPLRKNRVYDPIQFIDRTEFQERFGQRAFTPSHSGLRPPNTTKSIDDLRSEDRRSSTFWSSEDFEKYIPGVHYMEVNNDMSNLREVYEWCESHPDECKKMIQNSQELFQTVYAQENVIQYTKTVLEQCMLPESDSLTMDMRMKMPEKPSDSTSVFPSVNIPEREVVKEPSVPLLYINLDKRTDRREQIEQQLNTYGLSYERLPAIYHSFGIVGCTRSHLAALRLAKESGYQRVWIMEDDFEFLVSREDVESTLQMLCSGDIKFDVCMFAYNALQQKEIEGSDCFFQICEAETASSYVVEAHYYDKLIQLYEKTIPLLEKTRRHWDYANDQSWKILQSSDHWIATKQRMGKQRHGFSDNAQEYMSYDF